MSYDLTSPLFSRAYMTRVDDCDKPPKMAHKVKKPKAYTPACASDIRETLAKHAVQNQTKSAPIVLQYPIRG